jgi:hypothetical protein
MWGIFLGVIKFLFGIFGLLNTVFKFIDTSLTFDQVLGRMVTNIINDVISMISNMCNWETAVLSSIVIRSLQSSMVGLNRQCRYFAVHSSSLVG